MKIEWRRFLKLPIALVSLNLAYVTVLISSRILHACISVDWCITRLCALLCIYTIKNTSRRPVRVRALPDLPLYLLI